MVGRGGREVEHEHADGCRVPVDLGMPPSRQNRVRVHQTEAVIRKVPEKANILGPGVRRRSHLAGHCVRVALSGEPIADGHAGESGISRRLLVADGAGTREVLGVALRSSGHANIRAHRRRADRGAKVVVCAQHVGRVVRPRGA